MLAKYALFSDLQVTESHEMQIVAFLTLDLELNSSQWYLQVREEQAGLLRELRDGDDQTPPGTREVPQHRHQDERESSIIRRNDADDNLFLVKTKSIVVVRSWSIDDCCC